ncbi:tetratricopeptide repeat protein [Oceanibaculum pacificum]|uniref:Uncharacterized protein n=1 Tax=Oceanibaculum pacificum TaxID=580166 RepID=A0A154WFC0_9PROT|nr:tetratricopeptide repeat protein [Oceanibaculum pacificum]KZD12186.1 hypothetical protein AUP43_05105 [Oceanibaculum pacificum]
MTALPLPSHAQSPLSTAIGWHRAGKLKEAAGIYRLLLAETPDDPDILHLLGMVGQQLGHFDFAVRHIVRAIEQDPSNALYHGSLGLVFLAQQDYPHAVMALGNAARLQPEQADYLANLAHALEKAGAGEDALRAYAALLRVRPSQAEACLNVANALPAGAQRDRLYRLALALNPANAANHYNAGRNARETARYDEAERYYRRALAIDPALGAAHANLAMLLPNRHASGRLTHYTAAMALDPAHSGIRTDCALTLLGQGDLPRGWALHEERLAKAGLPEDRATGRPRWYGEPLVGKTLLVWREQGIGDQMMFASCLPDLIRHAEGCRILLECDARLAPLFQRSFPEIEVIQPSQVAALAEAVDFQIPIGSLPLHFRWRLSDFPHHAGYLSPAPERRAAMAGALAGLPGEVKIGLCWRSIRPGRKTLTTELEALAPMFDAPGLDFVNLQYGDCDAEIAAAERDRGIRLHRVEGLDLTQDLDGVAALIASLDLVVTVGTSVGEMAGALGVPCWRLGRPHEWTLLGTGERPWFPSMRLFSLPRPQPLAALVPEIRDALAGFKRDCRSFRLGQR